MNEAEFERRAETNAAMFRDKIKQRNPGKSKEEVRGRGSRTHQRFGWGGRHACLALLPVLCSSEQQLSLMSPIYSDDVLELFYWCASSPFPVCLWLPSHAIDESGYRKSGLSQSKSRTLPDEVEVRN